MRAVIFDSFGGPEKLKLGEWQNPEPGEGELLVKVHAAGVNRADTQQREGKYPPPPGESPILGLEMAGEVVRFGKVTGEAGRTGGAQAAAGGDGAVQPGAQTAAEEESRFKPGDRVCGLLPGGGYAEYAVIPEGLVFPVPEGMDYTEAAAVPEAFMTAFQALRRLGDLQKGEWILIHAGASGVGTAAVQLAREMEAGGIIVTASGGKHRVCLGLGADYAVDYKKKDFKEAVLVYTDNRGVDVVVDFIAAPYFERNLEVLRTDGRLVMLALLGGVRPEAVNLGEILKKRLRIIGSTLRSRSLGYKTELARQFRGFALSRFRCGSLKPVIDRVFSWEDAAEAHRYMEGNRNAGKIVLQISG